MTALDEFKISAVAVPAALQNTVSSGSPKDFQMYLGKAIPKLPYTMLTTSFVFNGNYSCATTSGTAPPD